MRPDNMTLTLTAPLLGVLLAASLLGCGGGGGGSSPPPPANPVRAALVGKTWRVASIAGADFSVPTCPGTATSVSGIFTFSCGADDRVTFRPDGTQTSVLGNPDGTRSTYTGTWGVSGSTLTVVNTAVTPPDPTLALPETITSSVTLTDATHFTAADSGITYAFQQE